MTQKVTNQDATPRGLPFLFGAQYYRAPTPSADCWEADLSRMRELGFNAVKFWAQWRWSHREADPDRFYWEDIDRLMDLAAQNELAVTLNTIFDVAPLWLYRRHPDARQVDATGAVVEPYVVGHRQIGGHPGPCYNHSEARAHRERFLTAAVGRFAAHPAMSMWDVWNEPEQAFHARRPDLKTLVCCCPNCRAGFRLWLERKYETLDRLNRVWGRWYDRWEEVEVPTTGQTIADFIDWREFHLDTMTAEAKWRLDIVRRLDPARVAYLHVVPNTMQPFNSVTCVDDFDIAEHCDVWAATMNGSPAFTMQVISAARGKAAYNVESHVNFGSLKNHQRILSLNDLLADLLPQVGLGVRGFLFWQYRPERLGIEAPAWGLVGLDGSDRPVTRAAQTFHDTLRPHVPALMGCPPAAASIGVWKSRRNEIFHFCVDGSLVGLAEGVEAYLQALYWQSYPMRFVSGQMLERGDLEGLKLLILPAPMYVSDEEAAALDRWVRAGGVLLTEAHLASYSATDNRHAVAVPGAGLHHAWGICETDTTAVPHLRLPAATAASAGEVGSASEDERKALEGVRSGGEYLPCRLEDGGILWGAQRYAVLAGDDLETWATFDSTDGPLPIVVSKTVGCGQVIYAGTQLGLGARQDARGLADLVRRAATAAHVLPTCRATDSAVHVDVLSDDGGTRFVFLLNRSEGAQVVRLEQPVGGLRGLFTGMRWDGSGPTTAPPGFCDLFVITA